MYTIRNISEAAGVDYYLDSCAAKGNMAPSLNKIIRYVQIQIHQYTVNLKLRNGSYAEPYDVCNISYKYMRRTIFLDFYFCFASSPLRNSSCHSICIYRGIYTSILSIYLLCFFLVQYLLQSTISAVISSIICHLLFCVSSLLYL